MCLRPHLKRSLRLNLLFVCLFVCAVFHSLRFRVHYNTEWGQNLYVTGADSQFGNWIVSSARRMRYRADGFWELEVPLEQPLSQLTYKYVLVDDRNGATFWEGGDNRTLQLEHYYTKNGSIIECRDTWMVVFSLFLFLFLFLFFSQIFDFLQHLY